MRVGFIPDQVEITFCGNRALTDAELQRFMAAEKLTLVTIVSSEDRTQNAYYLRIAPGANLQDRIRELANNTDVRSVGVVPMGVPIQPTPTGGLPSTSTVEADDTPWVLLGLVALIVGLALAVAAGAFGARGGPLDRRLR